MIEGVPGDPACRVTLRPAFLNQRFPVRRPTQFAKDCVPKRFYRGPIIAFWNSHSQAELSSVNIVRSDDVLHDPVAIAATASWPFSERRWGRGGDSIEHSPGGFHQCRDPLSLFGRNRAGIALCYFMRHPEIGVR
jgi:hypothetical protein